MAACERHMSGRVVLEVETTTSGQVHEARILAAEPAGLFDRTALTVARGSRLSPAYRDGQPISATALLTLHFAPERATCPGMQTPDREPPSGNRPPPRVTWIDERPASRAEWWGSLSRDAG
jgi:TonB family protein